MNTSTTTSDYSKTSNDPPVASYSRAIHDGAVRRVAAIADDIASSMRQETKFKKKEPISKSQRSWNILPRNNQNDARAREQILDNKQKVR